MKPASLAKNTLLLTAMMVAIFSSTSRALAERAACLASDRLCLWNDDNHAHNSVVRHAAVAALPSGPGPSPHYNGHTVLDPSFSGDAQAVDWDSDGNWDQTIGHIENGDGTIFVDEDGDGMMDNVDLDGDGNIDLGPDGDDTIFHFAWLNAAPSEGTWIYYDHLTGIYHVGLDSTGYANADPAHPLDPDPATAPQQNINSLTKGDANDDGTQSNNGNIDSGSSGNASSTASSNTAEGDTQEQAQTEISGPRPRCPEGYGEGGHSGSGGSDGSGRPGRQSDGGGGRS